MSLLDKVKLMSVMGIVIVVFLGFIGWGLNVYKLVTSDFEAPYKNEAVRAAGIPIPIVGAIAGWMDIEDGVKEEGE